MKILVVDSDPAVLRLANSALRILNGVVNNVITAFGTKEALEQMDATNQPFDVVISDLDLDPSTEEQSNGVLLALKCQDVRKERGDARKKTRIILMSKRFGDTETKARIKKLVRADYLTKPIKPKTLVARIRALLRK